MDVNLFVDKICQKNSLDVDKLKSNCKNEKYSDYRRALTYILRKEYKYTLTKIRDFLGKKSHSSIHESLKKHENLILHNKKYKDRFDSIKN